MLLSISSIPAFRETHYLQVTLIVSNDKQNMYATKIEDQKRYNVEKQSAKQFQDHSKAATYLRH